ncbi:kinase-like protein [Martensiomyces pterosporus]|nr:kinase-like protein [Martensiomyces pterosporus]
MVTLSPAPAVLVAHTPQVHKWAKSRTASGLGEAQLPAKYLLRVYGAGVDEFLSREKELYWLNQLTSLGFGPKLFGIFGNGRLEEFLESSTLTKEDIRHTSTSKHIARRMCELHSLVSYYRPFDCNEGGEDVPSGVDLSGRPELWANVDAWMRLVQKKWQRILAVCAQKPQCMEILNSWDHVKQAVEKLRAVIDTTDSPVVFAHDDLQYGNILRLSSTGELVVVDFEYAGYNYRGFDIANHFCEWMADYHHPQIPHLLSEDLYPSKEQRVHFLRTYVKAKAIDSEVQALDREVAPFVMASHFHWGIWGLLQACSSDIDFDYVGYAAQRLSIFLRMLGEMDSAK